MQLVLFIVIVTFTPLSCDNLQPGLEVLSVSSPNFYGEFESLPEGCQNKLKNEMEQRCHENKFHPKLLEVSECEFKCGGENNNGQIILTHSQSFTLKDGTPCGKNKICIEGKCIPRCNMPFVKGLRGRK
uniref:Putative conserved secreted protein n=1 Tax=Ixodes ricinus TaxID=34613 RepID=A0A6B0UQF4_IXORI